MHSSSSNSNSRSHSDNFKCNSEQLKKQARRNKNVCCGALPSISAIAAVWQLCVCVRFCVCVCYVACTPAALFSHCCFTLILCQCNTRTKATTACKDLRPQQKQRMCLCMCSFAVCCCTPVTHTITHLHTQLRNFKDQKVLTTATNVSVGRDSRAFGILVA